MTAAPDSAWRNAYATCSSENFERFIGPILSVLGPPKAPPYCSSNVSSFSGETSLGCIYGLGLGPSKGYPAVVSYLAVRHNEPLDSCRLWLDDTPTHRLRVDVTHNLQAASVVTLSGGGYAQQQRHQRAVARVPVRPVSGDGIAPIGVGCGKGRNDTLSVEGPLSVVPRSSLHEVFPTNTSLSRRAAMRPHDPSFHGRYSRSLLSG